MLSDLAIRFKVTEGPYNEPTSPPEIFGTFTTRATEVADNRRALEAQQTPQDVSAMTVEPSTALSAEALEKHEAMHREQVDRDAEVQHAETFFVRVVDRTRGLVSGHISPPDVLSPATSAASLDNSASFAD